jgi:hypothetical protein
MSSSKTQSATQEKVAPLTPEQRYEGEKNLVHLLIIAHDEGVETALQEWDRMREEKELANAQKSQPR